MNRIIITQLNDIMFLLVYEDDELVECHPLMSSGDNDVQIGNIYLGRVQKKVKNINSAFISLDGDNVGYLPLDDKPAFIMNRKLPKGLSSIAENDLILVQVEQEPQKMKQARVTGNINLSGKYCAVDIDSGKAGVSKKITDNETRERLSSLLADFISSGGIKSDSYKTNAPESDINGTTNSDNKKGLDDNSSNKYGYVLRTACENADDSDIRKELEVLTIQMDELVNKAAFERRTGLLYGNKPEYIALIESYGLERISEIKTNITDVYEEIIGYFNNHNIPYNKVQENIFVKKNVLDIEKQEEKQTSNIINISQYDDKDYPYHKLLGLETEISKLLNKKVWLKSGGFLVIEPTEAMVVIDVNTGKSIGKKNRDAHILKINIEAATEVARQLRLRNLSGIIMVDFINMDSEEYKQKVVSCLRREFAKDKVTTHFVDITKLDVFEITRKKQRRPLHEILKYRED